MNCNPSAFLFPRTASETITMLKRFDVVLELLRRNIEELTSAIVRLRYEAAWLQDIELHRTADLVEYVAQNLTAEERAIVDTRLCEMRRIVVQISALAPKPSKAAISQARSDGSLDRRLWCVEEQQWIHQLGMKGSLAEVTMHVLTKQDCA
jgi:hypothetical protein